MIVKKRSIKSHIYVFGYYLIWYLFAIALLEVLQQGAGYFFPVIHGSAIEFCAFMLGIIIAVIFANRRVKAKFLFVPIRGRSRAHFPIIGSDSFKASVNMALDELKAKAPERYREVLEYLPKAEYAPEIYYEYDCVGSSDGYFAIDGADDYDYFLFAMLHETGHNVMRHRNRARSSGEEAADGYANQVLKELGYPAYEY